MIGDKCYKEWQSWVEVCSKIQKIFNISEEEFNSREGIRELMVLIEKWGYDSHILRRKNHNDEPRGLLWKGD
jgi:hypothetical protein